MDDTDLLVVEDEAQRVPLTGNIPVQSSVTGNNLITIIMIILSMFSCAYHKLSDHVKQGKGKSLKKTFKDKQLAGNILE